jgi:phage gp46-like protein
MPTRPSPVPDIRLNQSFTQPFYNITIDWVLRDDGTLDDTQALATAIVVALGTNSLASIDDQLPDPDSTDRCGWWGDLDADIIWNAWPIGSKLWLMRRAAIESMQSRRGATVARIKGYIQEAIQPFVDNKIISTFDAYVERVDKQRIDSLIRLFKGPVPVIDLRYTIAWDELLASQQANPDPFYPNPLSF